jgi:hypothetical protein
MSKAFCLIFCALPLTMIATGTSQTSFKNKSTAYLIGRNFL